VSSCWSLVFKNSKAFVRFRVFWLFLTHKSVCNFCKFVKSNGDKILKQNSPKSQCHLVDPLGSRLSKASVGFWVFWLFLSHNVCNSHKIIKSNGGKIWRILLSQYCHLVDPLVLRLPKLLSGLEFSGFSSTQCLQPSQDHQIKQGQKPNQKLKSVVLSCWSLVFKTLVGIGVFWLFN
jgi:hypothetical protein